MKLILLGVPGAGKGTQAEILSKELNIPTVSTGNIIRNAIQAQTPWGIQAKIYVETGGLVPDQIVVGMLQEYLSQNSYVDGYILDGFPRNLQQARILEDMGIQISCVIDLQVHYETIQQRLANRKVCRNCGNSYHNINRPPLKRGVCDSCGGELITRKDDEPETILERLRVYYAATQQLVEFYAEKGVLLTICGDNSMEQITNDILSRLSPQPC